MNNNPESGGSLKGDEGGQNFDAWKELSDVEFVVGADATEASKEEIAKQVGRERFENERKELSKELLDKKVFGKEGSLKNVFKNLGIRGKQVFKYGIGRDIVMGRKAAEAQDEISKKGVYGVYEDDENAGKSQQAMAERLAEAAALKRKGVDDNENVFLGKNDNLRALENEPDEAGGVKDALRKMANAINDGRLSKEESLKNAREKALKSFQESLDEGTEKGNNYQKAAERLADQILQARLKEYQFSKDELDKFFDEKIHFSTGQIEAGLNKKESLDKTAMAAMKIAGEAGVGAGAVGVGLIAGTLGAKKALKAVLGGVAGGALIGAYEANKRAKSDIVAQEKAAALGEESKNQGVRIGENIERLDYEGLMGVEEAINELKECKAKQNQGNTITDESLSRIAEIKMRYQLSEEKGVDLLAYDGMKNIEKQRLELLKGIAELEVGLDKDKFGEALKKSEANLERKITSNEEKEKKYKRDRMLRGAVIGGTIGGIVAGVVDHEIGGLDADDSIDVDSDGTEAETGNPNSIKLVDKDHDGKMELMSDGQRVAETEVEFESDGSISEESQEGLRSEGFKIDGEKIEGKGDYNGSDKVSLAEYLNNNHENVEHINSRSWVSGEVSVGNPQVDVDDSTGERYYVMNVWSSNENIDVNDLQFGMSATDETQSDVFTYEIENGQIRIPIDSPEGSMFHVDSGSGNAAVFDGRFGEIMSMDENGNATVYSTMVGDGDIENLDVAKAVDKYEYTITKGEESYVFETPDVIPEVSNIAEASEISATINGNEISGYETEGAYESESDPFNMVPKESKVSLGPSLYDANKSSEEMYQDLVHGVAGSPEQAALWQTALDMDGSDEIDTIGEINSTANSWEGMEAGEYDEKMNAVTQAMIEKMDGGTIEEVDLSQTGYTKSIYEFPSGNDSKVLDLARNAHGVEGHALRLKDASGNSLLDEGRLRELYGIPSGEKGEFLVRLDCGGQIVWVPDETPEIAGIAEPGSSGGGSTTPTPTPEPEPEPEPEPTPTPTPTPEPEGVIPKTEDTNAGPYVDRQPVTPYEPETHNYVEADENGPAGRVSTAPEGNAGAGEDVIRSDEERANRFNELKGEKNE